MKTPESEITRHFRKNARKYQSYSFKITKDWQSSEDIVQELFIGLHERSLDGETRLNAKFIYEKLKFRSIDFLRKRQSEPVILDNLEEFILDEKMENMLEKSSIYGAVIDDICEILTQYTKKEIEIFERYHYEGHKLTDISQDLYISRYHVSRILRNIKHNIREELGKKYKNGIIKD